MPFEEIRTLLLKKSDDIIKAVFDVNKYEYEFNYIDKLLAKFGLVGQENISEFIY